MRFYFQDDPTAHQNFLKITRAYEVLKDDELRKKYDLHGEEGLKEDFHGGGQYESWSFYNEEFGEKLIETNSKKLLKVGEKFGSQGL